MSTIPTQSPSTPTSTPTLNLISVLQKQLTLINPQLIEQLCRKIYPVELSVTNPYNALYRTLMNYYAIQSNKGYTYENISGDITKWASVLSEALCIKMGALLGREEVKRKLLENMKKNYSMGPTVTSTVAGLSALRTNGKNIGASSSTLLENLGNKYSMDAQTNRYANLLSKQLNDTYKKENPSQADSSALIAQKYMKDKTTVQNLIDRIKFQKQLTTKSQLSSKRCLLCDNFLYLNTGEMGRGVFKCGDCGEGYHRKCMQRDNNCSFCQLESINPLQKVRKQLFCGFLRKGIKKHQFQFQVMKEYEELGATTDGKGKKMASTMPTIELRSIRLKDKNDTVANFINLFPDACTIMVNNRLVKQFQPLHKQSSLKYRRDECIKLSANLNIGTNKITITQRIQKKDMKTDERIEPENHVIGVYIVESMNVPKPANKLELFLSKSGYLGGSCGANVEKFLEGLGSKLNTFAESEILLKKSLFISTRDEGSAGEQEQEDLACQSIKAPLICSLTLQKMKYPGRSIFCKHFACFDIYNFILLNAQAKLPKWQCPICKASAYKFTIDCIMSSITEQLQKSAQGKKQVKDGEEPVEVEFDIDFAFKFLNSQGNVVVGKGRKEKGGAEAVESEVVPAWLSDIYDLPIEGKSKRSREVRQQEKQCHKMMNTSNGQSEKQKKILLLQQSSQKLKNQELLPPQQKIQEQNQPIVEINLNEPLNNEIAKTQTKADNNMLDFTIRIEQCAKVLEKQKSEERGKQRQKENLRVDDNTVSVSKDMIQPEAEMRDENISLKNVQQPLQENAHVPSFSSLSQKMSPEELQLQRALKQYEQHRKLKGMIKSGTEPPYAFSSSYHSYKDRDDHSLQKPIQMEELVLPIEQKDDGSGLYSSMGGFKESQSLFLHSQDEKEKGNKITGLADNMEINSVNQKKEPERQKPTVSQKPPKAKPKPLTEQTDNLFRGYSTRFHQQQKQKSQKRKIIRTQQPQKKQSVQRGRPRKMKEKEKDRFFEVPEDADVIELSD